VASSRDRARWLACSSETLFRSASIASAKRAASAARASSMEVSWVWSWLNRLSSDERLGGLAGPEPEALRPTIVRAPTAGFDGGFELVGGALMPLVDLVRVGATGLVSGFGVGAPRDALTLVAVLDGCRGLFGRLAPTAGSFRG